MVDIWCENISSGDMFWDYLKKQFIVNIWKKRVPPIIRDTDEWEGFFILQIMAG
jgi:hypothetical protein